MSERKLEILLKPHYHDNKYKPYFWCIFELNDSTGNWCNSGLCGWAISPEEAFNEAKKTF
jgi:hypothetical protein